MSSKRSSPVPVQLAVLALARAFVNTAIRTVYPFAPTLARGLGTPLSSIYNLITIRNFAGFLSPFFGPLSESVGRKAVMIGALLLFAAGSSLIAFFPRYWPFALALVLIALAKVIFDPAMQAHVGDTVAYEQRGMAFAVTEFSWAGALLIGGPAVGYVMQQQGWQAPFLWLSILGVLAAVLLWRVIPRAGDDSRGLMSVGATLRVLRRNPVVWAAIAYIMLTMGANETFFIIYGDWMEESFNLQLASLGLASGIIGGAEITGELFAGWSVDRFGKRPVIIVTGLLNALMYLIIPYTSQNLSSALLTLFALFLFFEITVVGGIPLLSEIVPRARGAVMAIVLAAGALGRSLGDLLGPRIWDAGGFTGNGLAASGIMAAAMLILILWVREPE